MVFGPATDLCFDPSLLPENQQFFCTIPTHGQSLLSLSLYSNEDGAVFEWKNWKLPTLNVNVAKSQNHIFQFHSIFTKMNKIRVCHQLFWYKLANSSFVYFFEDGTILKIPSEIEPPLLISSF